jgi:hypothetical protein
MRHKRSYSWLSRGLAATFKSCLRLGIVDSRRVYAPLLVVHPWHAARLVRQRRLDGGPFMIGEFVAHDSRLRFRGLNYDPRAGLNGPSIRRHIRPRRFRGKPDIDRLTKPADSVENDPSATSGSASCRSGKSVSAATKKVILSI